MDSSFIWDLVAHDPSLPDAAMLLIYWQCSHIFSIPDVRWFLEPIKLLGLETSLAYERLSDRQPSFYYSGVTVVLLSLTHQRYHYDRMKLISLCCQAYDPVAACCGDPFMEWLSSVLLGSYELEDLRSGFCSWCCSLCFARRLCDSGWISRAVKHFKPPFVCEVGLGPVEVS